MLVQETINWLLESSGWVEYHTRLNLMGEVEESVNVQAARRRMVDSREVQKVIAEVAEWPGAVLISHKSAGHPIHKLEFLADLGLRADDPGISAIIEKITSHQEEEGPFQVLTNIPEKFGGSGEDVWAWALCDAPLIFYALTRFELAGEASVQRGVDFLMHLVRENGWPCAGSTKLGTFRGPGRKCDPCPYANLIMLKLLAANPATRDSQASRLGAESILKCWAEREAFHPYIFYMGNDFCKIKAPLVWYDLLHVTWVLAQFPWLKGDERLNQMKAILASKADAQGRFTPESVWLAWKEWDFGQKKVPSAWLTYLAQKILSG